MSTKSVLNDPKEVQRMQFFSTAEVALILGVSRKVVLDWIRDGHLPAFRLGPTHRVIRIRKEDLDSFIAGHIQNQPPRTATVATLA